MRIYVKIIDSCAVCPNRRVKEYSTFICKETQRGVTRPSKNGTVPEWCPLERSEETK